MRWTVCKRQGKPVSANTAARTALYQEQREAVRTARKGLLRIMDSEESTPAEILEAARLLAELGK